MQGSRRLRSTAFVFATLGTVLLGGCWLPRTDGASFFLKSPLVAIPPGHGSGRVEFLIDARSHSAYVEVAGLAPGAPYAVLLDGAPIATLATDAAGSAQLDLFDTVPRFDPRGRRFSIADPGGVEMLELAAPTHPSVWAAEVAPLASFAPGTSVVQTTTLGGAPSVSVSLAGVEPGTYDVVVDGVVRATIDAPNGTGIATIAPPDFDPTTASFEIQLGGVGYFAGTGHASIEGIDWCAEGTAEQALPAAITGVGQASLATRVDCGRRFRVAIRDVPQGDYDLFVGGIPRGVLAVGEDDTGSTIGEAYFSSSERSVYPLDFDPIGQSIEVALQGTPYFALDAFAP